MPSPDLTLEPPADGEPTKRCPYCAETIKAAAIKCRFCQSDLAPEPAPAPERVAAPVGQPVDVHSAPPAIPVIEPQLTSEPEAARATSPVEPSEPAVPSDHFSRFGDRPTWLVVAVAVAVVLTLVFLGLAFKSWRDANELEQSAEAGHTARAAVTDQVETLLSYDYSSFDDDLAAAEKVMTSSFQKEYAPTVAEIRDRAVQQKRSQQAQVAAVSVIDQSPDEVSTLVFVNTTSSTEDSRRQRLMQNRVKVTLVKQDGTWLIDDLSVPLS